MSVAADTVPAERFEFQRLVTRRDAPLRAEERSAEGAPATLSARCAGRLAVARAGRLH